ncbi:hypothetical protein AKO1_001735 [Acrasis kona]|uniref:Uncharacterized protein n=1 Tax=Acrasis kona TaxID=1008807 RepID=A0AAW2Z9Z5_9EUKA
MESEVERLRRLLNETKQKEEALEQVIKQIEEAIKQRDEALDIIYEGSLRKLSTGIPKLQSYNGSGNTKPSNTKTLCYYHHEKITIKEVGISEFVHIKGNRIDAENLEKDKSLLSWSTEKNVQELVERLLTDISKLCKATKKLAFKQESALSDSQDISTSGNKKKGARWDNAVLHVRFGNVCGVGEVKKPNIKKNGEDLSIRDIGLFKQIFNYLCQARDGHEVNFSFGFVTTYNYWRICWLQNAHNASQADTVEEFKKSTGTVSNRTKLYLYVTEKFSVEHKNAPKILLEMLFKMSLCENQAPENIINSECRYHFGNESGTRYKKLPDNLTLSHEWSKSNKSFYILHNYGPGGDGRTHLVCDTSGRIGVLKILKERINATAEEKRWIRLWGNATARQVTIHGEEAIFMKYAYCAKLIDDKVIFTDPRGRELTQQNINADIKDGVDFDNAELQNYMKNPAKALNEALEAMSRKKMVHKDVEWRHLALLPVKKDQVYTVTPILIDLTRVSAQKKGNSKWKSTAYKRLVDQIASTTTPTASTTTPIKKRRKKRSVSNVASVQDSPNKKRKI